MNKDQKITALLICISAVLAATVIIAAPVAFADSLPPGVIPGQDFATDPSSASCDLIPFDEPSDTGSAVENPGCGDNPPSPGGAGPPPACPTDGCLASASTLGIPQLLTSSVAKDIIYILSFVAGALSGIFLVIGGIRYSTSSGDPQQVATAKHTVVFAIIGLVVSILAPIIVGFVVAHSPG